MTPEQVEQLFTELRDSAVGTRIKFHLQDASTTIEGIVIEPPGDHPAGLEDGIFLQDVEDYTQVYCLCPDNQNGVGNILVHTFVQARRAPDRTPSPNHHDEISRKLKAAEQVTVSGGATGAEYGDICGVVDTEAPPPPPTREDD